MCNITQLERLGLSVISLLLSTVSICFSFAFLLFQNDLLREKQGPV